MSGDPLDELREWLDAHWDPAMTLRAWWAGLGTSGWAYPHYPTDWFGRGLPPAVAGAASRLIRDAGAVPAPVGFGPNMAAPTVLDHGTDEQRRRILPGIVRGEDAYCQLFSEPNAGSDLAGLQCRAELDGDTYIVNGQKVWTSGAQIANKAMLLARTDIDVPKHAGLSYFIVDLDQPGVLIRPIREMTGRAPFNEVFLTDVRVPAADLIGGAGSGWAVANTTLAYERGRRSTGAVPPHVQPGRIAGHLGRAAGDCAVATDEGDRGIPPPTPAARLVDVARHLGRDGDAVVRQGLARLHSLERILDLTARRARDLAEAGQELPGFPQLSKMARNHQVRLSRQVTFDVLRELGTLLAYDDAAVEQLEAQTGLAGLGQLVEVALFASGPPIYGGSDQIQRNILGERVLGLAREPGDDRKVPFRELRKN
jgi:alkylation response protein AidB-like acyl-CoA dehydrogenase